MKLKKRTLQLLQKIGLTPSEAQFFWSVYRKPGASVKEIQNKAKLSKSSAYRAFEALRSRGLIVSQKGNWKNDIRVVSFKNLRTHLAKEQLALKKMELKLKEVEDLMQLSAFGSLEEPLQILMNKEDMQEKAQELLFKKQDRFYVYGSVERLMDTIGYQAERDFIRDRIKKGITAYGYLTEYGSLAEEIDLASEQEMRRLKIDINENEQDHVTYIFDDEVVRWQYDEQLGARAIVIRDPALNQVYLDNFKSVWGKK